MGSLCAPMHAHTHLRLTFFILQMSSAKSIQARERKINDGPTHSHY